MLLPGTAGTCVHTSSSTWAGGAMSETVFVVERVDGKWDASCFDRRCGGWGLHGVGGDDGVHETENSARRAAAEHRRELAAKRDPSPVPAVVCPTCGHWNVPKERR